ncbi:hypothetical protein ACI3PL_30100, partial [Lacticaseibacillus paracasei]
MKDDYTLYINPKSFYKSLGTKTEDQNLNDLKEKISLLLKLDEDKVLDLNTKILKIKDKKNDVYFELIKGLD